VDQAALVKAAMETVMRMLASATDSSLRAVQAIKRALSEVSTIKLKEIRHQSAKDGEPDFAAYLEVVGHPHTLACKVNANGQVQNLRSILEELREGARQVDENATLVLIAPYLSPEARAICKDCRAGFLDLEGNARIVLGEVFIVRRTMPRRVQERALDPILLQGAIARPPAPAVYIANNIPGTPVRAREGAVAGIAMA
jgi:hypothetical protein